MDWNYQFIKKYKSIVYLLAYKIQLDFKLFPYKNIWDIVKHAHTSCKIFSLKWFLFNDDDDDELSLHEF